MMNFRVPMRRQSRSIPIAAVLMAGLVSCQEPPAADVDDAAAPPAEMVPVTNLPLKTIMQDLETDLSELAHGVWMDDGDVVRQAAGRIADHPKVVPSQMALLQGALGADFPNFVAHDQEVHQAAVALAEEGPLSQGERFDGLLRIQRGCLACHEAYRDLASEALAEEGN